MDDKHYIISTYDIEELSPMKDGAGNDTYGGDFKWTKRLLCDGARAAVKAIHHFEGQGYDRQVSILVELCGPGGLDS